MIASGAEPNPAGTAPPAAGGWPRVRGEWRSRVGPPRSPWFLLLAPIVVVLGAVLGEWSLAPQPVETGAAVRPLPEHLVATAFGPADYAAAQAVAADGVALGRERVRKAPDEWLREESLAAALMADFSLSGDYETLAEAGRVLDAARRHAITGSGPWLREAAYAMAVHDLDTAEGVLENAGRSAVPLSIGDRAEIMAMRGDIALYRGAMDRAAQHYAEAARLQGGSTAFRQAMLARMQGRFDDALVLFGQAAREGSGMPLAQSHIALQMGATESARGRYDAARRWYDKAESLLPGQPLVALYRAEAQALAGDVVGAAEAMEAVADRHEWPEAMDALAMFYRAQGDRKQSRKWSDRASNAWETRMRLAPSAARFHMAEHALAYGDPAKALTLAQQEVRSRPYAESHILLANALIANGRPEEAAAQLHRAEESGWRSAPLYAAEAEVQAMLGMVNAAEEARNKAEALNPRIFDHSRMLVWFAHG